MPRRLRVSTGGFAYHVLNRAVGRGTLFGKTGDFEAMLRVIDETHARLPIRILSYCLMSNHWHFVLWPDADGQLSEFMRLLTVTHTQRWHAHHHTAGTGPLYQGRYKSFPIQQDEHFLAVCRYVEQNPLRAGMVKSGGDWRWSSFSARRETAPPEWLLPMKRWPVPPPADWSRRVNRVPGTAELDAVRSSVRRGRPFGDPPWQIRTAAQLSLQSTLRPRGRQRVQPVSKIKDSRPLLCSPVWSAALGVASYNHYVEANHISLVQSSNVQYQVNQWLNDPNVPLGSAQRAAWNPNPPVSDRNAYQGSTVNVNDISTGGGLNPDAIIKVELSPTDPYTAAWAADADGAGIHVPVLTGMIKIGDIGAKNFTIVSDETSDNTLDALGAIPLSGLTIDPSQLSGATLDDWVAFRNTWGKIGRRHDQYVTGPDGVSDGGYGGGDDTFYVGYEMDDIPGGQSPPTILVLPPWSLPVPTKGGTGNLQITVVGTLESSGTSAQAVTVDLYDEDTGPDDLLQTINTYVFHPTGTWDGLLLPYTSTETLFVDSNGWIAGTNDTSGESPAQLYQFFRDLGISSGTITVP